jgi:glycosyltransferase involved in cell wall biosynthesis
MVKGALAETRTAAASPTPMRHADCAIMTTHKVDPRTSPSLTAVAPIDSPSWMITHDYAYTFGGAERCTALLAAEVAPKSKRWVVAGTPEVIEQALLTRKPVRVLPKWFSYKVARSMAPALFPMIRALPPVSENLLCSSYALAHLPRTTGVKVIYCHSPMRQIYSGTDDYFSIPRRFRSLLDLALLPFRRIDRRAAQEADAIVATNLSVARRVRKYWGVEPVAIIPPPVDRELFAPVESPTRSYYLYVGRIVEPYKKLSLLLASFAERTDATLLVVGDGRDRRALERSAPQNVQFLGSKSGAELASLMGNARALVFPSADDFGMTPLEAMASGTPVIAFSGGGARETVVEGRGGVHFHEHTVEAVLDAIDRFESVTWDAQKVRVETDFYDSGRFVARMKEVLEAATRRRVLPEAADSRSASSPAA